MTFGYGTAVCPDCYDGEQPFLFFDNGYWLNRIMSRLMRQGAPRSKPFSVDPTLYYQTSVQPEIEVGE
jgi:hypothetical protein